MLIYLQGAIDRASGYVQVQNNMNSLGDITCTKISLVTAVICILRSVLTTSATLCQHRRSLAKSEQGCQCVWFGYVGRRWP